MYVEGRVIKVENNLLAPKEIFNKKTLRYETTMVPAKKVYIQQLMTGVCYWGYSYNCKVNKQYPDVVRIDGIENFHLVDFKKQSLTNF